MLVSVGSLVPSLTAQEILPEIGEHKLLDDEKKFKMIWKMAKKDEFEGERAERGGG